MQLAWKKTWRILFFIIVLGTALRFYDLGNNSFVADEFLDINSSYGYAKTSEWKAWDFNYDKTASMNVNDARDERAYVYKWQVAELFRFLPPTESTARLVSVLWGIFSIVVMFWTGWFYTQKKTIGLLAAFLFAVSVSGIIFDRRLRMYAMFFPVFLAFATSLFALFEREYNGKLSHCKKIWDRLGINVLYVLPVLVFGVLSFKVHDLSISIIPIFGTYLLWMALLSWKKGEGWKNKSSTFTARYSTPREGHCLHSSPWQDRMIFWKALDKYTITLGLGLAGAILLFLFSAKARLLLGTLSWFENHYSYFGYILSDFAHPLLGILIVAWGGYFLWGKLNRSKEAAWLVVSAFVPLIMAVWLWNRNAGSQYIFFAQAFVTLLAATGIYGLGVFMNERLATYGKKTMFITFGLGLLLLPDYGYFFQKNNTYHETSSGSSPNYRKVFSYFKKNMDQGDVLITRNFRNYYFSGAKVPVYDFGGELSKAKFSLTDLQAIIALHPHGWVIVSTNDYDYITNETQQYFIKNMERVSNDQVRGAIEVYRW